MIMSKKVRLAFGERGFLGQGGYIPSREDSNKWFEVVIMDRHGKIRGILKMRGKEIHDTVIRGTLIFY